MHMHEHRHKSNGETPSIPREQLRSPKKYEVSAQRGRSDCRVHVIKSKMFR